MTLAGKTILGLALSVTLSAFVTPSAATAQVVAKVDGAEITRKDVALALEDIGKSLPRQLQGPARQAYVLNYLIDLKLAASNAERQKLDQSPEFKRKIEYFRQKALMESYLDELRKVSVDAAKIKAVYDEAASKHKSETEVRARHVLVPTKPEAEAAAKRIANGEDFAKVAKEVSKDPGSPSGDLGWFTRDKMVPEFADMAFKTDIGKISPPVKSQFGWHIIKVEGRRQTTFPKLEQVRSQIEQFLNRKAQRAAILALRKAAKIEKPESGK